MSVGNTQVEITAGRIEKAGPQRIEKGGVGEKQRLSAEELETMLLFSKRPRQRNEGVDVAMENLEEGEKKFANLQYGRLSTNPLYGP
jgi:hypothetical protein